MFANSQEVDAVLDGPFGQSMHAKLGSEGIVGLAYFELGFRNITNSKRAIHNAEDIEGLTLGVIPDAIKADWIQALGANPAPLAVSEVYAALKQHSIEGQENPLVTVLANRYFEVQKHLAITNHQYNPQSLLFSKMLWDGLNADERKVLQDAAAEAARFQRRIARSRKQHANRAEDGGRQGHRVVAGRAVQAARQNKVRDRQTRRRTRSNRACAAGRAHKASLGRSRSGKPLLLIVNARLFVGRMFVHQRQFSATDVEHDAANIAPMLRQYCGRSRPVLRKSS